MLDKRHGIRFVGLVMALLVSTTVTANDAEIDILISDLPDLRKRVQAACPKTWEPKYSRLIYINGQETGTESGVLYEAGMDVWHASPIDKARYITFAYKELIPEGTDLTINYASADGSVIVACSKARDEYFAMLKRIADAQKYGFDVNTVRDDDDDGVFNLGDQCQTSFDGFPVEDHSVDAMGCAAWERDEDSDGTFDYYDQCPGTPEGVFIDINDGCIDSDQDGKSDRTDSYPYQHDTMCTD